MLPEHQTEVIISMNRNKFRLLLPLLLQLLLPLLLMLVVSAILLGCDANAKTIEEEEPAPALPASLLVALTLIPMLATLGDRATVEEERAPLPEPRTRAGGVVRRVRVFLFSSAPVFLIRWLLIGLGLTTRLLKRLLAPLLGGFERGYQAVDRRYPRILDWALNHSALVLVAAFGLFAGSLLIGVGLGVELIPQLSQGEFKVELRLPPGTPLKQTDEAITDIQLLADELDRVDYTFAVAGSGNRLDANPEQSGENWGELSVALLPGWRLRPASPTSSPPWRWANRRSGFTSTVSELQPWDCRSTRLPAGDSDRMSRFSGLFHLLLLLSM